MSSNVIKSLMLLLFTVIFINSLSSQTLVDYYQRLNPLTNSTIGHKYYNADTSLVIYRDLRIDTLCSCNPDNGPLIQRGNEWYPTTLFKCSYSTRELTDATIQLSQIFDFNLFSPFSGHPYEQLIMPDFNEAQVVSVENLSAIAPGELIALYPLHQYRHCDSGYVTLEQWRRRENLDYYLAKVLLNYPEDDRNSVTQLFLDTTYQALNPDANHKLSQFHYPNLDRIFVPIEGSGVDKERIKILNWLLKANPQATGYLSVSTGKINDPEGFESLKEIVHPIHVDINIYHIRIFPVLDSIISFLPENQVKSLRLIFNGSFNAEAADLSKSVNIQKLSELEYLFLEGKVRNLPANIHNLKKLKLLAAAFERIPDELGKIKTLEALELHGTYLDTFNDFHNELYNVELLSLKYLKDTTHLPSSFKNFKNLKVVYLSYWNNLVSFSPFYDLPIELMVLHVTPRPWSFLFRETEKIKSLNYIAYGYGEYGRTKNPPFDKVARLYIREDTPPHIIDEDYLSEFRKRNKLIVLNSGEPFDLPKLSNELNALINEFWWSPIYQLKP